MTWSPPKPALPTATQPAPRDPSALGSGGTTVDQERRHGRRVLVGYFVVVLLALPCLLLYSTERFTLFARFLAWVGLAGSLLPGVVMLCRPRSRKNAVAAVGLIVTLFYHLAPLHERSLLLRWGQARLSDLSIEHAALLSALAVPAMWLGWYLTGFTPPRLLPRLRLQIDPARLRKTAYFIIVTSFLAELLWLAGVLTTYQPVSSVISVLVPLEMGFAMLLILQIKGQATARDRLLFWTFLLLAVLIALARGTLLVLIRPFLVYLLAWMFLARRLQIIPVIAGLGMVLLMQPVKGEFRHRVWDRDSEMGIADRAILYVELIGQHWLPGDEDPLVDRSRSVEEAAARTGAALALANVVELTPASVPHQYGATLNYLLYAIVPRIIYPDKPTAQWADVWASVMYGYTNQQGTAHVMVGLSQIAESYINFGLVGGLLWLMLSGGLVRLLDEILGHDDAGSGALALYLYMVLALMINMEGSFAQFWGGVLQLCVVYGLMLAVLGRAGQKLTRRGPFGLRAR